LNKTLLIKRGVGWDRRGGNMPRRVRKGETYFLRAGWVRLD